MPRLALGTRVWVVLIVCVLTEPTLRGAAAAQPAGNVAVDGFRPAIDARGLFTVNGAQSLGSGEVSFGLGALGWGHRPLALDGDGARYSIDEVVTATLIAAVGLRLGGARLELGASLPLSIMSGSRGEVTAAGAAPQGDTRAFRLAGQGVGSAGLHLKVPLVRARGGGLGVAALASVYLPAFGARDRFLGEDQVVPQLTAVVDRAFGRARRLRLALNAGARLRKTTTFTNRDPGPEGAPVTGRTLTVSSELPLGLGAAYAVAPGRFELVGEVFGAIPLGAHEGYRPLEALAGIKVYLATSSFLSLGVGRRLGAEGGASADARAFLSIVFEPGAGDRDGDGIADGDDRCPDAPEDVDGFEDDDGCPDLDNDGDQVPDALDRCPNLPDDAARDGDRDGDRDGAARDGCPRDPHGDRDGDHILDELDRCPDAPEDLDGFEDEDGCPDLDNDRDRILDVDDLCPDAPEDLDGFEDDDGCPDLDNDRDRIPDTDDRCPDRPETYNAFEDGDGCPDRGVITRLEHTIVTLRPINFEYDRAVIKRDSYDLLDAVVAAMNGDDDIERIDVRGHTDERGDDAYNLDLSERRAAAVVAYLVAHGVAPHRLTSHGFGETQPVDPRHTAAAWTINRRVEFVLQTHSGR